MSASRAKTCVVTAASTAVVALIGPVLVVVALQHSLPVVGITLAYLVLFVAFVSAAGLEAWSSPREAPQRAFEAELTRRGPSGR